MQIAEEVEVTLLILAFDSSWCVESRLVLLTSQTLDMKKKSLLLHASMYLHTALHLEVPSIGLTTLLSQLYMRYMQYTCPLFLDPVFAYNVCDAPRAPWTMMNGGWVRLKASTRSACCNYDRVAMLSCRPWHSEKREWSRNCNVSFPAPVISMFANHLCWNMMTLKERGTYNQIWFFLLLFITPQHMESGECW